MSSTTFYALEITLSIMELQWRSLENQKMKGDFAGQCD